MNGGAQLRRARAVYAQEGCLIVCVLRYLLYHIFFLCAQQQNYMQNRPVKTAEIAHHYRVWVCIYHVAPTFWRSDKGESIYGKCSSARDIAQVRVIGAAF